MDTDTDILKYYSLDEMCKEKAHLYQIIGKRACGKTLLTKYLSKKIIKNKNIESITIFTNECNNYSEFNNANIFLEYNSDILKDLINKQRPRVDQKPILIIMDDCIFDKKINNDENFKKIVLNSRGFNIYLILTFSYCYHLSPQLRCNFDYILSNKYSHMIDIKKLYESYFGMIPKFDIFNNFINKLDKYEFILADYTLPSNKIIDNIGYFKLNNDES